MMQVNTSSQLNQLLVEQEHLICWLINKGHQHKCQLADDEDEDVQIFMKDIFLFQFQTVLFKYSFPKAFTFKVNE